MANGDDPNVETSDEFVQRMKDESPPGSAATPDSLPAYKQPDQQQQGAAPRAQLATPEDKLDQQQDDAIQQTIKFNRQFDQDRQEQERTNQWVRQEQEKLLSEPLPKMPSYSDLYGDVQGQQQQQSQALKNWKRKESLAMLAYAAIALPLAFFTRGAAGAGAMRGFSAGLDALKEGFDDKAKQHIALWKAQNDQMIKEGDRRMKYYKDVLSNRKLDMEERMQMLDLVAKSIGDKSVADAAEAGQWSKTATLLHQREQLLINAKKKSRDIEQAIFPKLGLDQLHKDYVNWLAQKHSDLRKGLYSSDSDQYWKAYDDGSSRLGSSWEDFLQQKATENKELHPGKTDQKNPEKTTDDPLGLGLPQGSTEEEGGGGGEW